MRRARMAGVARTFILNDKFDRREGGLEFVAQFFGYWS
jgi:hypothetical protein